MTFKVSEMLYSLKFLEDQFAPLIGEFAWSVARTHGSHFSMNFGNPYLEVREPLNSKGELESVSKNMQRRRVTPCGEWKVLIGGCKWAIRKRGDVLATNESTTDGISRALKELDGQRLDRFHLQLENFKTHFYFDLGAVLETESNDPIDEQWTLYRKDGSIAIFRGDGRFFIGPGNYMLEESDWKNPTPSP